jgi:hypothetical protein
MQQYRTTIAFLGVVLGVLASCSAPLRPGAVSQVDQVLFDTLSGVQDLIEEVRPRINSGELPLRLEEPFNALVAAYNVAEPLAEDYAAALRRGESPSISALRTAMDNVDTFYWGYLETSGGVR